jgi:hypothetical protein
MRRKLKIGGRVNLLIAVPLLALVACGGLGFLALQRASVRGEQYQALKVAQDLRADTLPPPASLLGAWAEVNAVAVLASSPDVSSPAGQSAMAAHLRHLARAEQEFGTAMDRWSKVALDPEAAVAFDIAGRAAGEQFFASVRRAVVPAVERGDGAAVMAAVRSLEPQYHLQQVGAQQALDWAQTEVLAREAQTGDFIATVSLFGGAGAALLVSFTLLMSVRLRRSIIRPIRSLAAQASAVANIELPRAVEAMADLPAEGDVSYLRPFEVDSDDELADLAAGFNSVQNAAVDLAAEQERSRRIVSENLVNIATRNDDLLGRTLSLVTALELNEGDPKMLDHLFRIDHLTTRMRRNAQSLVVLAGVEPTREPAPAVPLEDVVRSALSGVENYGQVEIGDVGDVAVSGAAAPEISHLLAELLENATSFSPASTDVTVVGRAVRDGHHLAIYDHGPGMSEDDMAAANERLTEVPSIHRDSTRMLGFQVVARLAARHGVHVTLTTTPGGSGVTAVVRLPKAIVEVTPEELPAAMALVDLPEASARLTMPLPIIPMMVESVSLASFESAVSTGEVDSVGPLAGS